MIGSFSRILLLVVATVIVVVGVFQFNRNKGGTFDHGAIAWGRDAKPEQFVGRNLAARVAEQGGKMRSFTRTMVASGTPTTFRTVVVFTAAGIEETSTFDFEGQPQQVKSQTKAKVSKNVYVVPKLTANVEMSQAVGSEAWTGSINAGDKVIRELNGVIRSYTSPTDYVEFAPG